jgi:hypothetical protein
MYRDADKDIKHIPIKEWVFLLVECIWQWQLQYETDLAIICVCAIKTENITRRSGN